MKTEKENIRHGRGKSRRRRLIPAVQLAWLVAFLASAVVAAVRCDWTGLSIALLWACNVAMALKFTALEEEIQEQGEADANAVLANSLNDQVLQQHYIDALESIGKDGNLVVVPEGSQPIVGTK